MKIFFIPNISTKDLLFYMKVCDSGFDILSNSIEGHMAHKVAAKALGLSGSKIDDFANKIEAKDRVPQDDGSFKIVVEMAEYIGYDPSNNATKWMTVIIDKAQDNIPRVRNSFPGTIN